MVADQNLKSKLLKLLKLFRAFLKYNYNYIVIQTTKYYYS